MHTSITVFTKISLGFSGLSCLLSLRRFSKTTHPTNYRRSRAFVSGQTSTYHGSFKTKSQRAEWQVLASSFLNASVSLASPCSYVSQSSLAGCESLCQRISTRLSSQAPGRSSLAPELFSPLCQLLSCTQWICHFI